VLADCRHAPRPAGASHLLNTTPVMLHVWGESERQMKNLPARLRKHADEVLDPGYPYYGTPEMVREAADEIERLRLTAEEREAVQFFADIHWDDDPPHEYAATLRAMLERLA